MRKSTLLIIFFYTLFLFAFFGCQGEEGIEPVVDDIIDNEFPEPQDQLEILFIGNSYTGFHNMPGIFAELVASSGKDDVYVDSAQTYNKRLPYFLHDLATLSKLHQRKWDIVIIPQSQYIVSNEISRFHHLDVSIEFEQLILENNPNTKVMFFMEQAFKKGDDTYSPHDNFELMTERVIEGSVEWAERMPIKTPIAPVAAVWGEFQKVNSRNVHLHMPDGYHASVEGAYATACTFFASIFKEPVNVEYYHELVPVVAQKMQTLASKVVLENLEKWQND
ncbi:MAG: hypothetical protein KKA84_10310 [Bacteroidetes bacterium]|nr:hypothetical protein [Bacteroidota bacterium]